MLVLGIFLKYTNDMTGARGKLWDPKLVENTAPFALITHNHITIEVSHLRLIVEAQAPRHWISSKHTTYRYSESHVTMDGKLIVESERVRDGHSLLGV